MKNIILTGDRPTGQLHIGHYLGSLKNRVDLQNSGKFDEMFIMIADSQALTDNFDNPQKVQKNVFEVCVDYLSCGIDENKCTIFLQSQIPALCELTFYYQNLVSLSRLTRNPTVKEEIKLRGFEKSLPVGFVNYPISQAADITAFEATCVPVGEDQLPMIEQTREIVKSFNNLYGETLVLPKELLSENKNTRRVVGIDGNAKMSKSLNNAIYLADSAEEVHKKVMKMYTDPEHINVADPGKVKGNVVFTYLDYFCTDQLIQKYTTEYKTLDEMKNHYKRGGLGDVKCKKLLISVLNEALESIREKRKYYEQNKEVVYEIIRKGTEKANAVASKTFEKVKSAMGIDYKHIFK